jgi:chaperonin GroES
MKVRPLGDRLVVRRNQPEATTAGGIVLPDSAKNKPQQGEVLAVGPGRLLKNGTRQPLQVKAGDVVYFTSYAGDEFKHTSTSDNILVMHESDILAVIEK